MSKLLLDVLRDDITDSLGPSLESISQDYLNDLLTNDELFSMDAYTTTTVSENNTNSSQNSSRNITEEIAELDFQERQLNLELSALTYKNKDIIIDVSHDLTTINEISMHEFNDGVSSMVKHLSQMETNSITPSKSSANINEKLYKSIENNNTILSNIDSVLDLLELPSLCKLCILQGNYQESLEISMLVQSLLIRFPGISIFNQIHQQVEQELRLMVKGLVKLLNTNLKQNNILKIFQILNKLDLIHTSSNTDSTSFGSNKSSTSASSIDKKVRKEKFLKIIYLNARYKFIVSELNSLQPLIKFNKLTYLKRYIEIYREHIFSTLSIYQAIFSSSNSSSTPSSADTESNATRDDDSLLINQFIRNLVTILTKELKLYYGDIDQPTDLSDAQSKENEIEKLARQDGLLLQIIYLCKSLAKYNVDFESIILWDLCYNDSLISERDWKRNLKKVKRFRN